MNFDRIRVKAKKAERGNTWEVVRETHKAGEWDGPPSEVSVIERGLTLTEAKKRVKKEQGDKPEPPKDPYGNTQGWF